MWVSLITADTVWKRAAFSADSWLLWVRCCVVTVGAVFLSEVPGPRNAPVHIKPLSQTSCSHNKINRNTLWLYESFTKNTPTTQNLIIDYCCCRVHRWFYCLDLSIPHNSTLSIHIKPEFVNSTSVFPYFLNCLISTEIQIEQKCVFVCNVQNVCLYFMRFTWRHTTWRPKARPWLSR